MDDNPPKKESEFTVDDFTDTLFPKLKGATDMEMAEEYAKKRLTQQKKKQKEPSSDELQKAQPVSSPSKSQTQKTKCVKDFELQSLSRLLNCASIVFKKFTTTGNLSTPIPFSAFLSLLSFFGYWFPTEVSTRSSASKPEVKPLVTRQASSLIAQGIPGTANSVLSHKTSNSEIPRLLSKKTEVQKLVRKGIEQETRVRSNLCDLLQDCVDPHNTKQVSWLSVQRILIAFFNNGAKGVSNASLEDVEKFRHREQEKLLTQEKEAQEYETLKEQLMSVEKIKQQAAGLVFDLDEHSSEHPDGTASKSTLSDGTMPFSTMAQFDEDKRIREKDKAEMSLSQLTEQHSSNGKGFHLDSMRTYSPLVHSHSVAFGDDITGSGSSLAASRKQPSRQRLGEAGMKHFETLTAVNELSDRRGALRGISSQSDDDAISAGSQDVASPSLGSSPSVRKTTNGTSFHEPTSVISFTEPTQRMCEVVTQVVAKLKTLKLSRHVKDWRDIEMDIKKVMRMYGLGKSFANAALYPVPLPEDLLHAAVVGLPASSCLGSGQATLHGTGPHAGAGSSTLRSSIVVGETRGGMTTADSQAISMEQSGSALSFHPTINKQSAKMDRKRTFKIIKHRQKQHRNDMNQRMASFHGKQYSSGSLQTLGRSRTSTSLMDARTGKEYQPQTSQSIADLSSSSFKGRGRGDAKSTLSGGSLLASSASHFIEGSASAYPVYSRNEYLYEHRKKQEEDRKKRKQKLQEEREEDWTFKPDLSASALHNPTRMNDDDRILKVKDGLRGYKDYAAKIKGSGASPTPKWASRLSKPKPKPVGLTTEEEKELREIEQMKEHPDIISGGYTGSAASSYLTSAPSSARHHSLSHSMASQSYSIGGIPGTGRPGRYPKPHPLDKHTVDHVVGVKEYKERMRKAQKKRDEKREAMNALSTARGFKPFSAPGGLYTVVKASTGPVLPDPMEYSLQGKSGYRAPLSTDEDYRDLTHRSSISSATGGGGVFCRL
ncbi:hypothetical protein ADUPG1_010664 [Aduncisulcus paluster]|uniref:Uncharacterized protein n=1 Tax=Aduncisulcus paluster TaxID=2918883 RepID=A0ABQ5JUK4_9EUKA|nr:hypothetical protein ADUPG1_010664 [Aduncisulcus paluster]